MSDTEQQFITFVSQGRTYRSSPSLKVDIRVLQWNGQIINIMYSNKAVIFTKMHVTVVTYYARPFIAMASVWS